MTTNATTRKTRTAAGKCAVCLSRKATAGHVTCVPCRETITTYSADRYAERRDDGKCYRCGEPADGYLCEPHAAERRAQRRRRAS